MSTTRCRPRGEPYTGHLHATYDNSVVSVERLRAIMPEGWSCYYTQDSFDAMDLGEYGTIHEVVIQPLGKPPVTINKTTVVVINNGTAEYFDREAFKLLFEEVTDQQSTQPYDVFGDLDLDIDFVWSG